MGATTERRGAVLIITIDRPERRNAMDHVTALDITRALEEAEADSDLRVVILTGAGEKAFCSGFDLSEAGRDGPNAFIEGRGFAGLCEYEFPKPLIAAVNGLALGGGFEMVLACDLVVAAEHATFGLPEVKIGGIAGAGALVRLPRRTNMSFALEMILTGEPVTASDALANGIVNRVVPATALLEEAVALAQRIARNAPLSVQVSRRAAYHMWELPLSEAWKYNAEAVAEVVGSNDTKEGIAAFLEKREPRWTGS